MPTTHRDRLAFVAFIALMLVSMLTLREPEPVDRAACMGAHSDPDGAVAEDCRDAGYTVTDRVVLDPAGRYVWTGRGYFTDN